MRKMLKGLSILQMALISIQVSAVLGLVSAVFNFSCGWCGLKGEKGEKNSLSAAVKLGWLGLIAAVVSGVLTLFGDVDIGRIVTVASSSVVPVLFLISAKSVRRDR